MRGTWWTEEQVATLVRLYPTVTPQEVAAAVGRPVKQCYAKAHDMGIKSHCKPGHKKGWKPPAKIASTPCLPASRPAPVSARGPAFQPGPPIITAKTKYTIAPSPKTHLRTATYATD